MKFVANGMVLSDAAFTVSKACAVKTITPVLECIKIVAKNDVLTLTAYDGEISIEKKIKAEVLEEGVICVNGKLFTDFVGKIYGKDVVMYETENGVRIGYGENETFIQTLDAEEYPKLSDEQYDDYFEVKESEFKNLVLKTAFCCATDDGRPILKGCLLESSDGILQATAIDGFRMAVSECDIVGKSKEIKIVCPARTLTEIVRMMDGGEELVRINVNKNMLSVAIGGTSLKSRLYIGEFVVRKENIFPVEFTTTVTVNRKEMIESLERASIVIRGEKINRISLEIRAGSITMSAVSEIGNVTETIEADTNGKDLKILIDEKFVLDALKALEEEKVVFSFNNSVSPFTVENVEMKRNAYLILPMRTSSSSEN